MSGLISKTTVDRTLTSTRYIWHQVITELTSEVSRFHLSYLWWLLEPCLMIGVFFVIFGLVFDRGGEDYISFLILGVTAWLWFAHTVGKATNSVRKQLGLMRQVYVAKYVFPFSAVLFGVFKHLFVILILMGVLLLLNPPSVNWLFYFPIALVQLLLILAVSTFVASIVPFIPDLSKIIPPILQMGMFLSGVFYPQSMIPAKFVPYFRYNPMAGLIMEYRKVILEYQLPDFNYLAKVAFLSVVVLGFGLWVLKKFDKTYPRLTD